MRQDPEECIQTKYLKILITKRENSQKLKGMGAESRKRLVTREEETVSYLKEEEVTHPTDRGTDRSCGVKFWSIKKGEL